MKSIKNKVLEYLKENKEYFRKKYGIKKIYLFGSVARGEDNENSDIDIMVEFISDKFHTFDNYFDLKYKLEDKFKRKIDLATKEMIREKLKKNIYKDIINA
ncbi:MULTISPECIES: nucleotidyltransferase family protein [unclassified Lebetimonas]|uniref:nucleotidyltransferase family protein n=1 Tax=unclassified Lebetimonas TaxID=2648158 RepID=UPI00046514DF|nr:MULTISPECIES: nucleotidyltransferase family protein [unclassified Lebetimonas]